MSNIETIEQKHNELLSKKAKAEAQLDILREKTDQSYRDLDANYGVISLDELETVIDEMINDYETRKTAALAEQTTLVAELNDVINAVKV